MLSRRTLFGALIASPLAALIGKPPAGSDFIVTAGSPVVTLPPGWKITRIHFDPIFSDDGEFIGSHQKVTIEQTTVEYKSSEQKESLDGARRRS
jgi:hypothetical protein